jgi:hypothetical protein
MNDPNFARLFLPKIELDYYLDSQNELLENSNDNSNEKGN